MQEHGNEIRTFMPRYGCINERRHQLHEVIRLSGMNLIIDDNDHQLIIKVASIPAARVQIYFIDNDDYFSRKAVLTDGADNYFQDNDERAIFFARGVLETVKKLRWTPTWHIKRDLYDWWLKKIQSGTVSVGHRYWSLSVLASYGIKCDIPEDEVMSDALELLPLLDDISDDDHNRFTKRDVLDAMNMYQESYVTYSRAEVERVSGISVPPNKRNGRKQAVHLERARAVQNIDYPDGEWRNKDGRPEKSKIVEEWQKKHPDGRKVDCQRDTGLDPKTIRKWWK